jgi:hypothetical protein
MMFVGKPATSGWPAGDYEATCVVENNGSLALETSFKVQM